MPSPNRLSHIVPSIDETCHYMNLRCELSGQRHKGSRWVSDDGHSLHRHIGDLVYSALDYGSESLSWYWNVQYCQG